MPRSFMRTLRLKVRREAYAWLNAAAVEVNEVFNYCNETSLEAATGTDTKRKWRSGFDLCNLAARCRADALHKFSKRIIDRYQNIVVGDVSSSKLVRTPMAKSVLDSGWGMLKGFLEYKSQQAARGFEVVSERNTSVTCSTCGSPTGPRGVNGLIVRFWVCSDCGESHDRDVNAARNILIGSRSRTSVRGNESSSWLIKPSRAYRVREAGIESAWTAA